jgi:simple sugar transport system permease protein
MMPSPERSRIVEALLPPTVALLIALAAGSGVILAFGEAPIDVYARLLEGTWGNLYGLGQVIYKATTLVCTGLAVALALRAGLFNIGAESQLAAGGFAAAAIGLTLPESTPAALAVPLCVGAALGGGAIVGAIPGVLKARFGAHEVIVTILLNFIVLACLNYVVSEKLHVHETVHTPPIIDAATMPRFTELPGSAANATSFVVLAACALVWLVLARTRFGFELRAVGASTRAAQAAGVRVGAVYVAAMSLSGALAGLGGAGYVLGYKHYYEDGFAGGAGFLGIAVALVGRNHPVGVVVAAFLFATLSQGGLAIHALVPKQMVEVLQALVIGIMAAGVPAVRRSLERAARPASGDEPPEPRTPPRSAREVAR